jgi:hypothetical protein
MSTAPFDVTPIIERIRAKVTVLRQVAGAADFAAVKSLADYPAPCAYVVLARDKSEPTQVGHAPRGQQVAVAQDQRVTFGVIVAVANYREQPGAQLTPQLQLILGAIRDVLLGFVPDVPGARPCLHVQGDLTDYNAGTALWTDVWQTAQTIGVDAP